MSNGSCVFVNINTGMPRIILSEEYFTFTSHSVPAKIDFKFSSRMADIDFISSIMQTREAVSCWNANVPSHSCVSRATHINGSHTDLLINVLPACPSNAMTSQIVFFFPLFDVITLKNNWRTFSHPMDSQIEIPTKTLSRRHSFPLKHNIHRAWHERTVACRYP